MDRAEVEKRVKKVVSQVLNVPESNIKPEHKFTADLGAASVQSLELVAGFEEEFDIEVDEDEALSVQSVGDAVEFFVERLV
ncbi:MAG: acyl carrier protein [Candidatus Sumerlaeota bacterium]|nr:acyl carrier protein [Candidatus Sumerlaeota bacterium]